MLTLQVKSGIMSSSTVQGHCPFRAKQLQLISPSRHLPLLFLQRHELLFRSFCSKAQFTHFPVLSSTRTVPTSAMVVRGSTKPLASTASNSQAHTDRPSLIYFQRHLRGNKLVFQRQSAILQWAAPIYHRRLPIPTRFEHYRECWKALEHQCCSTAWICVSVSIVNWRKLTPKITTHTFFEDHWTYWTAIAWIGRT